MNRTVLITGIAGFLGRAIAREFARNGWRIAGIDKAAPENASLPPDSLYLSGELPSPDFANILSGWEPAVCVHCAGRASVPLSMKEPAADFASNTVLTFELLEAIRKHAPECRFIFLSSAAVYGNPESLPVTESQALRPLSPYGFHKVQGEMLCEEFTTVFGLPTAIVRIFSAYGPGLRRQVIWDICTKILSGGPEIPMHGTGRETRDFIHATDVAKAVRLLADSAEFKAERYNLASGEEVAIADLFTCLADALGSTAAARFNGHARGGDPLAWRADISRLAALGFRPGIPLEQGLRGVAGWAAAELRSL